MAFTNHLNILPDPNNPIGDAGETGGGTAGPGFALLAMLTFWQAGPPGCCPAGTRPRALVF